MSEMNQEFENESVNPSEEPSKVPENPKNKTGKRVKYLVAGALGLVILSGLVKDSVYQIQEQEQAVLDYLWGSQGSAGNRTSFQAAAGTENPEGKHHHPGFSNRVQRGKQ